MNYKSMKGVGSFFVQEDFDKYDEPAKNAAYALLKFLEKKGFAKNVDMNVENELEQPYHRDLEVIVNGVRRVISTEVKTAWMYGKGRFPYETVRVMNRKSEDCHKKNALFTDFFVTSVDKNGIAVISRKDYDSVVPNEVMTTRGLDWGREIPIDKVIFYRRIDAKNNIWEKSIGI